MISFKQFIENYNKKFVSLWFDEDTNKNLYKYAIKNGFNLSVKYNNESQNPKDFDFHITIYFTTTLHDTKEQEIKLTEPFEIIPDYFELLGDDKNIPVLKVKNTGTLEWIRNFFTDQGYRDNWPDYKPHISLSYDKKDYELSKMPLPKFSIVADRLTVQNQ